MRSIWLLLLALIASDAFASVAPDGQAASRDRAASGARTAPGERTASGERTAATGLAAEARSILGPDQGVYVEATDGTVLLAQAAAKAVHPASVSKIPTTLALLQKLGPEHRFVTTFSTSGRVMDGVLVGDLSVECGGDPSLVDEDALVVAERLAELGIRRIAGTLRVRGTLTFDWQSDLEGLRLRQALSGSVSPGALATVRAFELENSKGLTASDSSLSTQWIRFEAVAAPDTQGAFTPTASEQIGIAPAAAGAAVTGVSTRAATGAAVTGASTTATTGAAVTATNPTGTTVTGLPAQRVLVIHRSQPLLALAKSLNDYSNNIFKPLADQAGGAAAVEALARNVVPMAMRPEITLGDGAGTDPRNRMSPRIVVSLLRALDRELQATGHALFDILPVAGIDDGTLRHRLDGPGEAGRVVGKTGTFGDYGASALAGAISTTDRGTVYFAILNHNVPVPEARRKQDRFVRLLLANLHTQPWGYQRDARPAIARVEVLKSP